MLVHLSCFGGLKVTAETPLGPGFLDPRRVALLAVLAAAGSEGCDRDHLRELLCDAVDDATAEAELSSALDALRRGGNGDALIAGEDVIRLDPTLVTSDVTEFLDAVAAGDKATVARIYEGPFLHGVALDAGPRFAAWLTESRERFNAQFQDVMAARRAVEPEPESVADAGGEAEISVHQLFPYRWVALAAAVLVVVAVIWAVRRPHRPSTAELALTTGDPAAAVTEYRRRLSTDPSDALLWLGLARALDRGGDGWAADSAAWRADSLSGTLSSNNARLVHGYRLWRDGNTERALTMLDSLVRESPDFNEARVLQAEVVERSGAFIGRSRRSARVLYEQAVVLDSSFVNGWRALLAIAVNSSDTALAQRSWKALAGFTGAASIGWRRTFWSADTMPLAAEVARIDSIAPLELLERARWIGLVAGRTAEALRFTVPLRDSSAAPQLQQQARLLRAELYGSVADWSGMEHEATALASSWPWGGLMLEVAAALAPGRSLDRTNLRRLRTRVMRAELDSVERSPTVPAGSRTLRLYLVGQLSARLGDATGVQAAVDSLSSPKLGEFWLPRRGGSYALSLQALQFAERGDSAQALATLTQSAVAVPVAAQQQLWVNGSLERRFRALLLEALGHPEEASGWRASIGDAPADLLLGPAPLE